MGSGGSASAAKQVESLSETDLRAIAASLPDDVVARIHAALKSAKPERKTTSRLDELKSHEAELEAYRKGSYERGELSEGFEAGWKYKYEEMEGTYTTTRELHLKKGNTIGDLFLLLGIRPSDLYVNEGYDDNNQFIVGPRIFHLDEGLDVLISKVFPKPGKAVVDGIHPVLPELQPSDRLSELQAEESKAGYTQDPAVRKKIAQQAWDDGKLAAFQVEGWGLYYGSFTSVGQYDLLLRKDYTAGDVFLKLQGDWKEGKLFSGDPTAADSKVLLSTDNKDLLLSEVFTEPCKLCFAASGVSMC
eukprot:TRINITY_DN61672_c0_g1_i1.p1 TRINITY_DN61672_c0_g1~~TRINITY_DN61672_c0_g1_i1.p1  ORF type:complete len:303 (-),score=54.08 TRINITY_DN61672_c0_g1_i1:78-986(-)